MSARRPTANTTTLDEALLAAGIDSDAEAERRGGPAATTLRRIRHGAAPRRDVVRRLARLLGVTEATAFAIVQQTGREVRS